MGGVRGADRDLVLACKAGQTGAWDRLVAKYERLVFSIPRSYGLSREDAADVSQAAFIALIGGLDSLTEEEPREGLARHLGPPPHLAADGEGPPRGHRSWAREALLEGYAGVRGLPPTTSVSSARST
jgi:hypothetical protein